MEAKTIEYVKDRITYLKKQREEVRNHFFMIQGRIDEREEELEELEKLDDEKTD